MTSMKRGRAAQFDNMRLKARAFLERKDSDTCQARHSGKSCVEKTPTTLESIQGWEKQRGFSVFRRELGFLEQKVRFRGEVKDRWECADE